MSWWRKLWGRQEPAWETLSSRRTKTFLAESGHGYQYYALGFRRTRSPGESAFQYAYHWACGPAAGTVSIILLDTVLGEWMRMEARDLNASERFGIATVALKNTFDRCAEPREVPGEIMPALEEVAAIARLLNF